MNKRKILLTPDANSDSVGADSSAANDANTPASSAGEQDVKLKDGQSYEDAAIAQVMAKVKTRAAEKDAKSGESSATEGSEEDKSGKDESESGRVQELNKTTDKKDSEGQQDKTETEAGDTTEAEEGSTEARDDSQNEEEAGEEGQGQETEKSKKEDFSKLPFHKHEGFKRVLKERNEARAELETAKKFAIRMSNIDQYCAKYGISPEQFKDALEVTALINRNPVEARKRIQPMLDHLDKFNGGVLPEDLQTQVTAGSLDLKVAKELAALRAQKDFNARQAQQDAAERNSQEVFNTLASLEAHFRKTDPDYQRIAPVVEGFFTSIAQQETGPITPESAMRIAQQAYKKAKETVLAFVPKQSKQKTLNSSNSSGQTKLKEPTTWEEAQDHVVQKVVHGRK